MLPALIAAVLGGAISIARIVVSNPSALTTLVWAEDGLFPLCIQRYGYFSCLVDPFAGYFLFLSRTLAYPVSLFDLSVWPMVTNIVAAVAIGTGCGFIAWLLIKAGVSRLSSVLIALVPVLIPIVGLEAVNASGSAYMVLLIIAVILVSFKFDDHLPKWLTPSVLLITALTIPSSVVLLLPLLARMIRLRRARRSEVMNIMALMLGLIVQFFVISTADNARPVAVTFDSFTQWVSQLPVAFSTLIPSLVSLADTGKLASDYVLPDLGLGYAILLATSAVAAIIIFRANAIRSGAGWLIILGLLLGLIPSLAGYSNNRYFVIPLVAVVIAILILVGTFTVPRSQFLAAGVAIVIFIVWAPGFGASSIRTNDMPPWDQMLEAVRTGCEAAPDSDARIVFTPDWPFADAVFLGPTSNVVPCSVAVRD